jgi:hypothetical protein
MLQLWNIILSAILHLFALDLEGALHSPGPHNAKSGHLKLINLLIQYVKAITSILPDNFEHGLIKERNQNYSAFKIKLYFNNYVFLYF